MCFTTKKLSKHNGTILCEKCYATAVKCQNCGKYVKKSTVKHIGWRNSNSFVCEECYSNDTFKCDYCGLILCNSKKSDNPYLPKDSHVCNNCVEYYLESCSLCEKHLPEDLLIDTDIGYCCESCFSEHARVCSVCGKRFVPSEESDHENICNSCFSKNREKLKLQMYYDYCSKTDFSGAKVQEIAATQLDNMSTKDLMTRLHPEHFRLNKPDYFDILLLKTYRYSFVIVNYEFCKNSVEFPPHVEIFTISKDIKKRSKWINILSSKPFSDVQAVLPGNLVVNIWQKPAMLRAMTIYDQDYRKEWDGYGSYIEYNSYGDTTAFFIIGAIKN